MKIIAILLILTLSIGVIPLTPSYAHQSGCHRWHSCPSDNGSYVCGDLGYDTYCPKSTKSETKEKVQTKTESKPTKTSKCIGTALCITDKVTKIVDGDTISIKKYTIRLSLTNTPEKNQVGFSEATSFTRTLCPIGSTITVDQDDNQPYDKDKRLIGKVFCGDKVLNSELLYKNHGTILKQYCSTSEFNGEVWAQKYGCKIDSVSKSTTPVKPSTVTNRCDPSYPDVCIPPYPPDLDCGEISYKNFRVVGADPHGFDKDNDGIGCEK